MKLGICSLFVLFVAVACGDDVEMGKDSSGGAAGAGATASGGTAGADAAVGGNAGSGGTGALPTTTAACQGHIYECGDLVDNDNDGLIDSQDPDCLGPCDDTEGSYFEAFQVRTTRRVGKIATSTRTRAQATTIATGTTSAIH